jgi:uncharacterized membrane protein YoaK (UPF0700 family)
MNPWLAFISGVICGYLLCLLVGWVLITRGRL